VTFVAKPDQLTSPAPAAPERARSLGRDIEALLRRACSRDERFRIHASNVAVLSVRVGTTLRLSEQDLRTLEFAAVLHDVGKLEVPAAIITKPSALDEDEWAVMRRHPVEGARLLAPLVSPEVLAIVRSHHERWDGAGYPDRLAGERIPLGARIVAVADAFCAMIEPRPYRAPRSTAAACAELLAQAGGQFDTACANAAYRVCAGARLRRLGLG
jgi:HD-GYP domain-containing protein (c-di-GMP phosphodiesterase class II)